MSTRSGKRIHASIDSRVVDADIVLQSNRKTRSKKQKENVELPVKKKHNYVSYPADEEVSSFSYDAAETLEKGRRTGKTRRNTLKEHNVHSSVSDNLEPNNNNKSVRTRRGKKLTQKAEIAGDIANIENHELLELTSNDKKRNKKKKNHKKDYVETAKMQDIGRHVRKETKQKQKKSMEMKERLNSFDVDGQEATHIDTGTNDASIDSFHSAASSPVNKNLIEKDSHIESANNFVRNDIEDNILMPKSIDASAISNTTVDVSTKKRRKSSINNCTFDRIELNDIDKLSSFDKSIVVTTASIKKKRKSSIKNSTFDKIETKDINEDHCITTLNTTVDVPTTLNTTLDVPLTKRKKSSINNCTIGYIESNDKKNCNLNTTFENISDISTNFNATLEVLKSKKRRSSIKNSTFDKIETYETKVVDDNLKCTFGHTIDLYIANGNLTENLDEHDASVPAVVHRDSDRAGDYNNDVLNCSVIMNTTFDKDEENLERKETNITNVTFDKEDKDPQISLQTNKASPNNTRIQSDLILTSNIKSPSKGNAKSKKLNSTFDKEMESNTCFDTENKSELSVDSKKSSLISSDATINITYDKSEENSCISITSDDSNTENILNHSPVLVESSIEESLMSEDKTPEKSEVPVTPLKRQGTFTKEVPDIMISPKPKGSAEKTPSKRKSSPGCTPFPFSKSSQKENVKLNVTRSIEKTLRRSSFMEVGPRQTRVMFCSPVNNPSTVSQLKGRVIKSNLKGSNKSFVFEESVLSETHTGRRKRSLTVGTAGDAETRVKRKRLGDELQHSVDRLSRPRTQSASAKLPDPGTPSKKFGTPSKAKPESRMPRIKLPNFAALHQKQFAKMESLDECQERKAKRAKQLLTPNGCVGLLERISPKGTSSKPAPLAKEPATKLHTPSKPKHTLESLNPGYTRFGFKLNIDANPFSVAGNTEASKEKPTGLSRKTTCLTLPSLAGATVGRRDAAKQTVMREKSFSEKRDVKRKETRTVIKGVRTNRRFELQMKLRNINS